MGGAFDNDHVRMRWSGAFRQRAAAIGVAAAVLAFMATATPGGAAEGGAPGSAACSGRWPAGASAVAIYDGRGALCWVGETFADYSTWMDVLGFDGDDVMTARHSYDSEVVKVSMRDRVSGETRWNTTASARALARRARFTGGIVVLSREDADTVVAQDVVSGAERWRFGETDPSVARRSIVSLFDAGPTIYVTRSAADGEVELVAIDRSTGVERWRSRGGSVVRADDDVVVVQSYGLTEGGPVPVLCDGSHASDRSADR